MALTTHEQIRVDSGFQSRYVRQSFRNDIGVSVNTFFVQSDDNVKIVPEFATGGTIAGVSDVQVWLGLSGIYGTSRIAVSSIDIDQGSVTLGTIPVAGSSVVISYSSSAVTSIDVENVRKQAEGIVNSRLALCYDLPLSPTPSQITSLATRLASSLLLIRGYATGANNDLSRDGYALYDLLMGNNTSNPSEGGAKDVGEIGLICTPNYVLVDDNGAIIPRNDNSSSSGDSFLLGGRVNGVIYDLTEEPFRLKEWQIDADKNQPGSGLS